MRKIRVIICPVDRPPYITNISDTLQNLQKTVGGYIEMLPLATDVALVCDEEGRPKGKQENRNAPVDGIVGDCILVGVDGAELCDLPHTRWLLGQCKARSALHKEGEKMT